MTMQRGNRITLTFIFLYCNVSTLKPMVGMVCTASSLSFWRRYNMVVFPALSNPRINIRTSFVPNRLSKIRLIMMPMILYVLLYDVPGGVNPFFVPIV